MPLSANSTQRFSDRVDHYVRYRPGYPVEVLTILERDAGLTRDSVIADIGSGTGISAALFLEHGNTVFAVEPNENMRKAAESRLNHYQMFHSVNGTAEATTISSGTIDIVVAAQAFHWFDRTAAKEEFRRILKPGGRIALMWNSRRVDTSPFLTGYEALLRKYSTDYDRVDHKNIDETILSEFFAPAGYHLIKIFHAQKLDYHAVEGRMLSSSYVPTESDPRFQPLLRGLKDLFDRSQSTGTVVMEYDTELYIGNQ